MTKTILKVTDFGLIYTKEEKKAIRGIQNTLESLRHDYFNRRLKGYDLAWLVELMTLTRRLGFGEQEAWRKVYASPYVTDHNQAFLEDSFDYLLTGKRTMTLQNWMDLIDFTKKKALPATLPEKSRLSLPDTFPRSNERGQRDYVDSMDYVETWCRLKEGPLDLLCTLFAVFCGHPFAFEHSHFRFPFHELDVLPHLKEGDS